METDDFSCIDESPRQSPRLSQAPQLSQALSPHASPRAGAGAGEASPGSPSRTSSTLSPAPRWSLTQQLGQDTAKGGPPGSPKGGRPSSPGSPGGLARASTRGFGSALEQVPAEAEVFERRTRCQWLLDGLCCRRTGRRRAIVEANRWLDLGPRPARNQELRKVRQTAVRERLKRLDDPLLTRRQRFWRELKLKALIFWEQASLTELLDKETGLPVRLLEEFRFASLEGEGPHGKIYKASRSMLSADGRAEVQEFVAIRIREKASGNVMHLPLHGGAHILRAHILHGRGLRAFFNRGLAELGLARAPFNHGCLVKQHAVFHTKEFFIEVSEWLDGGGLLRRVQAEQQQLDERAACKIMTRVMMALQYLHDRNLIHRDVRLSQIILPAEGSYAEAKVGDFWCMAQLPRGGFLMDRNIPLYLTCAAPEVIKQGEWSKTSDVWSAGCLLFELLHGHPPFGGTGEAMLQRICNDEPEFDETCGKVSGSATKLLKSLLRKNIDHRPTVAEAMSNPWFREYGYDEPKPAAHADRRIRCVALSGPPPEHRKGLPAENLLKAKTGMFNGGFCSTTGAEQVHVDFEIIGKHREEYWISTLIISLWGKAVNPRVIIISAASRGDVPFHEVLRHQVGSADETEARLTLQVPLRLVRIGLKDNFGGIFGIALRKVTFVGHKILSTPILLEMDSCQYARGSSVVLHAEKLSEDDVEALHPSLLTLLENSRKIDMRYRVYRDVCSGLPYHASSVRLTPLTLTRDVTIIAASLAFRYVSDAMKTSAPQVRFFLVNERHGEKEKISERKLLFEIHDLAPSEWGPKAVLKQGYADHPPLYRSGLGIVPKGDWHIEISIENKASYLHIPADCGLKLYYVPNKEVLSDDSDSDSDHERISSKEGKPIAVEVKKTLYQSVIWREDGGLSEHADSEDFEKGMAADMKEMLHGTLYGRFGPKELLNADANIWTPITDVGKKGNVPEADLLEASPWGLPDDMQWWRASMSSVSSATTASEGGGRERAEETDKAAREAEATTSTSASMAHLDRVKDAGIDVQSLAEARLAECDKQVLRSGEERSALRNAQATQRRHEREAAAKAKALAAQKELDMILEEEEEQALNDARGAGCCTLPKAPFDTCSGGARAAAAQPVFAACGCLGGRALEFAAPEAQL
mmetsp:Transcript_166322/g.534153  ORF Transcript_166322/g.534153 Transcript_166322/m.534153 type:complete len:1153 (-) Transcript_166322:65-3523(-)